METFRSSYDRKTLAWSICWILVTMVLMKASNGMVMVLIFPVAMATMFIKNSVRMLFVLLLMVSAQVGNAYLFPKNAVTFIAIRGTLLLLSLMMVSQIFGRKTTPLLTPFLGVFFYLGIEVFSSMTGFAPVISFLKMLLFSAIYFAFYSVANSVVSNSRADSRRVRSVVLSVACLFLIGSMLLIPLPEISLMTWEEAENSVLIESLFKGMTTHSQSLGPVVSGLATLLLADLVFSIKKLDKLYVLLLLCVPVLIMKTGSRTALGTWLGGAIVVGYLFLQARGVGRRWKGKVMRIAFGLGLLAVFAVMTIPRYRQSFMRFVLKTGNSAENATLRSSDLTFDAITASRQGKAEQCLFNFKRSPLIGNGFQVSDDMQHRYREGWLAYLSAPIEKGFWVFAILEEGGIIGLVVFSGFLLVAFVKLVRRHAYVTASCLMSMTLSNVGEFVFFSMTYTGGLLWAFVFAAVVLDAQRLRDQGIYKMMLNQQMMAEQQWPMLG